ncbi:MAG: tRNA 2-thiouridine(34) synthase MnmA [Proteobacteria bacterium]|nr:tRNA 2-thiouridine(34) synthase MnmA [Pseudomonadota bacterium]
MNKLSDVAVALSGGVDSSMAAALLKAAGWEVHGVHFMLPSTPSMREGRLEGVKRIAEHLEIPVEIIDLTQIFEDLVVEPFVDAYLRGLTPNPCVRCNPLIKFEHLHRYILEKKIQYLASGHYVRLVKGKQDMVGLRRGRDSRKDQSYFLHRLTQPSLSRVVFPLGEMTKDEVRNLAREMGLPCHSNPESQEICFISGTDYRSFVEKRRGITGKEKGVIITDDGETLGEHQGVYRYTIGQRHGLGIASSRPYYVKEIRSELNQVVVGRREALFAGMVDAVHFNWVGKPPLEGRFRMQAQVRYRHKAAPGQLEVLSSDEVRFIFDRPQWAVTPGQALVCYDGDRLIGGGWIIRNHSRS